MFPVQSSDAAPMAPEDSDIPTTDYDSDIEVRSYILIARLLCFSYLVFETKKLMFIYNFIYHEVRSQGNVNSSLINSALKKKTISDK